MLNALALSLLADQSKVQDDELRVFMHLVADHDLTQFSVITFRQMRKSTRALPHESVQYLKRLVEIGLLESGPIVPVPMDSFDRGRAGLYRVPPRLVMSGKAVRALERELARIERRTRTRPVRPKGTPAG